MSTPSIHPARPGDAEALLRLFDAFAEGESRRDPRHAFADDARTRYANDLREWLRSDSHAVFVAEVAGEIVGFQTIALWYGPPLYRVEREAFMGEIYVAPAWRRQGIATALIDAAATWARAQGAIRLRTILLDANGASVALWEKRGAAPLAHVYTLDLGGETPAEPEPRRIGFGT